MADDRLPPWIKLSAAAAEAAKNGQWQRARELGGAAAEALIAHSEQVEGELLGKRLAHRRKRAIEDWEYERDLDRGRGR